MVDKFVLSALYFCKQEGGVMAQEINNSRMLKKANRHLVLCTLRDSDALSVEELVQRTRLSRPTVLKLLGELVEEGIAQKTGLGESMGGRQPMLYALDLNRYFAVGVDFEFPPIRVVFSDLKGNIVFSKRWEQSYADSMEDVSHAILSAIREGLESLGISAGNVIGAGIGIPGLVDITENKPISVARMPGAKDIEISSLIERDLGIKTFIRNDAHLLALADRSAFAGVNKNMLYVAFRTGIGMAVYQKGALYEGECGNSGYLGHTTFDKDGALCTCGKRGCLELYCSKVTMCGQYAGKTGKKEEFRVILAEAADGKEPARQIVQEAARCFGIAIANAVKLFDISLVVLGDLPYVENDLFLRTINNVVNDYVPYSRNGKITVRRGTVEEEAYTLGGSIFVLDQFFKTPKLRLNVQ